MAQTPVQAAGAAALMAALGPASFGIGGGLTGGTGGSAGPATTTGINSITPAFDSSNWTVALGGSSASPSNTSANANQPSALAAMGNMASANVAGVPFLYIAGAGLLGILLWKRL